MALKCFSERFESMDDLGVIAHLARSEARNIVRRPLVHDAAELASIDRTIPLFCIKRDQAGKYACGFVGGFSGDYTAAYRAPAYERFFQAAVLPNVDREVDVSGLYHLELHDSASAAAIATTGGHGALTFGKDLRARGAGRSRALLPDYYQVLSFNRGPDVPSFIDLADKLDRKPFEAKKAKVLFAGTTTGDLDPLKNQRVEACRWARRVDPLREKYELYLTSCRQIDPAVLRAKVPEVDHVMREFVPEEAHFDYRYVLNICGNTYCWSRAPMILSGRSLMVNLNDAQGGWYYPLLRANTHFVGIDSIEQLPKALEACEANPATCKQIIGNANTFVKQYCSLAAAALYTKFLLEEVAAA